VFNWLRVGNGPRGPWPRRGVAIVFALIVVLVFGMTASDQYVYIGDSALVAAIGAIGLNVLTGNAGQVSIGNAAFLGLGAYTVILTDRHLPFLATILLAGIVAAVAGVLIGVPSLRLRGLYLVFSTLALQYTASFAFQQYDTDSKALSGHNIRIAKIGSITISSDKQWYVFLVIATIVVAIITYSVLAGRPGRAWDAIRANEVSAAIMGVDVRRTKLNAFVYSSFVVGVSGGITAYFLQNITSDYFTLALAVSYVAMVLVGGSGSVGGAIAGAILITFLPTLTTTIGSDLFGASSGTGFLSNNLSAIDSGVYGLLVLVFMFAEPGGLAGLVRRIERRPGRNVRLASMPGAPSPSGDTADPSGSAGGSGGAAAAGEVAVRPEAEAVPGGQS
jgi:branched-chain amino acid transport system permease protein